MNRRGFLKLLVALPLAAVAGAVALVPRKCMKVKVKTAIWNEQGLAFTSEKWLVLDGSLVADAHKHLEKANQYEVPSAKYERRPDGTWLIERTFVRKA